MAAEAATGAADTGNSPRIIQENAGTAGSNCCQPFFIVGQLFLAVGNNPILQPVTARAESSLAGLAKMARPDSAIAPNFISYSFLISRY
jgi:hypothetical protein